VSNSKSNSSPSNLPSLINRRIKTTSSRPNSIGFDELGNAQFQWHEQEYLGESAEAAQRREQALTVANLVLVDEEPVPNQTAAPLNKHGLRLGYNPYDSGRLERKAPSKRVDLRELSKWIEARKSQQDGE
jgi:hypothetical protein